MREDRGSDFQRHDKGGVYQNNWKINKESEIQ